MRKIHLPWMIAVGGIFCTIYGLYLLIYHFNHGNGLSAPALAMLIAGSIALLFTIALVTSVKINESKKKKSVQSFEVKEPNKQETPVETPKEEAKVEEKKDVKKDEVTYEPTRERREYSSSSSYYASTVYVKQVGYGPLLRVTGSQIVDMRDNTYYRIEGNMVNQDGYGPRFEIRGIQIRDVFGGYLYELSGSNINKVFGGFYASISGNYITLFDLSVKYEMSDSLSKKQILAVAALLFGRY